MKKRQLATPTSEPFAAECRLRFAPCLAGPERLVALGFRYWMLGCTSGEIECWERAWNLYAGHFGVAGARIAVDHLAQWVSLVSRTARREIEVFPESCRSFCRDECIAVSMIAACQQQTCPAMRACAFALAESVMLDGVVSAAQGFADTMLGLDQVLSAHPIISAVSMVRPVSATLQ